MNGPKLRGQLIVEQNVTVGQFLGVRYADKPKRFRRSKLASLNWTGIKDARNWPPFCMQNNLKQFDYLTKIYNQNVSEDCLFLNIWTPIIQNDSKIINDDENITMINQMNLLPVIIYIHGGGFNYMGISMEAYNGRIISAIGNVIFVTINYRVGLLGFFNNQLDDYDKNLGLYDQILAIEWIRKNIHNFGGDPNQITLQGQSAGAISIGLLMISTESRNLFKRVILQSASPMMLKQVFTNNHYDNVIQLANCTSSIDSNQTDDDNLLSFNYDEYNEEEDDDEDDDGEEDYNNNNDKQIKLETECIERLSSKKINEIQAEILKENIISFSPTIPSRLLPDYVEQQSDNILQKEILIGANANESTLYLHHEVPDLIPLTNDFNVNLSIFYKVIKKLDSGNENLKRLSSIIFDRIRKENNGIDNEKDLIKEFMIFLSDLLFKGPVFKFAKLLSKNEQKNVYLYLFHEENLSYPKWIGSPHWNEMDYVFGLPIRYPERFTKQQQMLSRRMIQTWTYFARTGKMLQQNGIEWPKLDEHNLHMNLMSKNVSVGKDFGMKFYDVYDLLYDST
uniref:Carboxylic ester hydrolase n=1 Tax=Dermatophagoides pteronyssinus TaxID=6956 RepID=A0A6P6Y872_DERPT|nr:bile salt-activated lipase-like [Dermatophagoides pteronyssinus]